MNSLSRILLCTLGLKHSAVEETAAAEDLQPLDLYLSQMSYITLMAPFCNYHFDDIDFDMVRILSTISITSVVGILCPEVRYVRQNHFKWHFSTWDHRPQLVGSSFLRQRGILLVEAWRGLCKPHEYMIQISDSRGIFLQFSVNSHVERRVVNLGYLTCLLL